MFDIDKFKNINDSYGHKAGDEVLTELAKRVSRGVRDIDLVSRYGGEEFVIVMPDADVEVALAVAERVRGLVADQSFTVSGGASELAVTIPGGVATPREQPDRESRGEGDSVAAQVYSGGS